MYLSKLCSSSRFYLFSSFMAKSAVLQNCNCRKTLVLQKDSNKLMISEIVSTLDTDDLILASSIEVSDYF